MTDSGDSIRILHVDDEPNFASMAAEFLRRENDRFEVVTESDATDGLEKLRREEFHCVVSDYQMPGTDGLEFLKSVRENHPDFPFILFTGKGSEEVAGEAISAGVTDYLQKESGTEQYTVLANRVQNVVEGYRSKSEAQRYQDLLEQALAKTDTYVWEWDLITGEVTRYPSDETFSQLESTDIGGVFDGFVERVHPDERERIKQLIEEGIKNGTGYQFECRFKDKDGSWLWIRDHSEVQMENDEPIRALGVVTVITESKDQNDCYVAGKNRSPGHR